MYLRSIKTLMDKHLDSHYSFTIYGARQVGKTTLVKNYAIASGKKYKYVDCDNFLNQQIMSSQDDKTLRGFIGDAEILILDEAQRVKNIGLNMKIIHDQIPEVKVIATGSSSLDLASEIKEPMTGRDIDFHLHPLSLVELLQQTSQVELDYRLDDFLIYGMYPDVVLANSNEDKELKLNSLTQSYLYKDILALELVKKASPIFDLLRVLAFSIGSEVHIAGLVEKTGLNKVTVEKYIDLLEQCFIIKKLTPLNRNIVKEIKHPFKVYFWDLGIRNALLEDFKPLALREDRIIGALWENFCVIERIKKNMNVGYRARYHFWRTNEPSPKEYDLIEEKNGDFQVFEIKTSTNNAGKVKEYPLFFQAYPNSSLQVIHRGNWVDWLV
jgi:uncharacterized protein